MRGWRDACGAGGTTSSTRTARARSRTGAARCAARFEAAVDRQLAADVPVGSYLSGGLDSGSLVALASQRAPRLMTFTGGFDLTSVEGLELVFDERASAESLSSRFRTEHYEMVMHEGDMAWALPDLIWHLEDLRVGMCYQNYYIARLASKFVKVSLSGAGGDELFGGYPWRYEQVADSHEPSDFERTLLRLLVPARAAVASTAPSSPRPRARPPGGWTRSTSFRDVLAPVRELDPYTKALYFERKTFLNGLLVVEDRVSMAHSLEARVPVPRQRARRSRRAHPVRAPLQRRRGQAGPARGARASSPTTSCAGASRASARPTDPGTAGRRWITSGRSCSTSAASRAAGSSPTRSRRTITSTSRDASTTACCSGRCSHSSGGTGSSSTASCLRSVTLPRAMRPDPELLTGR